MVRSCPRRGLTVALLVALLALAAGCGSDDDAEPETPPPPATAPETEPDAGEEAALPEEAELSTVATGLEIPWDLAFLPDGSALVTERGGRVLLLEAGGDIAEEPVAEIDVRHEGEGGLHGIELDPDFEENSYVYLYRTTAQDNQVVRARYEDGTLTGQTTIVDGIPAANIHNGGRLAFGPDGDLYVATGDAAEPPLSQDPDSLAGKILRLDGESARGDGGRPEVHSLGHRNPQGLAWHPDTGDLYAPEHGAERNDEVNRIEEGENYGWPDVEGPDHGDFAAPVAVYTDLTLAPSGAAFVTAEGSAWTGDLLVAGLRGEQIRRLRVDGDDVEVDEPLFEGELGRVRAIVQGPADALYALTSNRDGRGSPEDEDDRIVRILPPAG